MNLQALATKLNAKLTGTTLNLDGDLMLSQFTTDSNEMFYELSTFGDMDVGLRSLEVLSIDSKGDVNKLSDFDEYVNEVDTNGPFIDQVVFEVQSMLRG